MLVGYQKYKKGEVNIMKKNTTNKKVAIALTALLVSTSTLASCSKDTTIGIIGGADGPTSIVIGGTVPESSNVQIPNPVKIYDSLDFNKESEFVIAHLPNAMVVNKILLINGNLASLEVDYNGISATYRIASDNAEEISGVYYEFDSEETKIVAGVSDVSVKSYELGCLAEWSYDGYKYSLNAQTSDKEAFERMLEETILYTAVVSNKINAVGFLNTSNTELAPKADAVWLDETSQEYQSVIAFNKSAVITLYRTDFDEEGNASFKKLEQYTADKDDFCLRVYGEVPETIPKYAVTIEDNGVVAMHYISYDGRGERPTFIIFTSPEDTALLPADAFDTKVS